MKTGLCSSAKCLSELISEGKGQHTVLIIIKNNYYYSFFLANSLENI